MATPQAPLKATPQSGPTPTPGQVINSEPFDVFSQDMNFPNLPAQAKHQPGKAAGFESRAPDLDAGMLSTLAPAQRNRLQSERDSALQMDQQLHQVSLALCSLAFLQNVVGHFLCFSFRIDLKVHLSLQVSVKAYMHITLLIAITSAATHLIHVLCAGGL